MSALNLQPNLQRPDDVYEALVAMHRGRTDEESERINARLILILANHVGDEAALEAIRLACEAASAGE